MNLQFILSCLYFFLPAYFANMIPPLLNTAGLFKILDKPVDFDRYFGDGKPFLGSHKTWRGVIFGLILGIFTVFLQRYLYQFSLFQKISLVNYYEIDILWLALLFPLGAIFGDLLFAFIKRRLNLQPGAVFMPFDQTNYVIGASLFLWFFGLGTSVWIILFVATFFLHLIFNKVGYLLKLHPNKW